MFFLSGLEYRLLEVEKVSSVTRFALLCLLGIQALLLEWIASHQSPTINEPAHLVAGLSHLQFGSFALYRVNPPLVRSVAAIPVELYGYDPDWSGHQVHPGARPVFGMGERFFDANGRGSLWLMTLARWACIPFCLLGGWICFLWARDLFGPTAGLVACALWCFSPMVLGMGATIAPDAHASALGIAACYTFWRWLKSPTWMQAIVTGVVLGLAELSKTTFILFYPIWPVVWLVYRWGERGRKPDVGARENYSERLKPGHQLAEREETERLKPGQQRWTREAAMLAVRMLIGIYVLNLGYLGEGSFTQLGEFRFVSELFGGEDVQSGVGGNRFADTLLADVPVPFPSNYIIGIDVQQRDFENFGRPSYLRGEWQDKGWWYYYAYAVLVKAPLGTLGLMLLSAVVCFTRFRPAIAWRDAVVLLFPPLVIFAVASMKSGFSHHSRYILPCVPFVFVWLGQFGVWIEKAWNARHLPHWLPSPRFGERGRGRGEPERMREVVDRPRCPSPAATASDPEGECCELLDLQSRVSRETGWNRGGILLGIVSALLLAWSIGSSLSVYPHSLSYFNELAGGPKNGPAHLLNSNIDWGQDLLFLEQWVAKNANDAPVYTAFYNLYNPFDLQIEGIEPWPFRRQEEDAGLDRSATWDKSDHAYYAISVNLLYDYPAPVRDREGRSYNIDRRPHGYLRTIQPVGWAGYSIRIFSAEQMKAAFAAPPTTPLWEG